MAWESSKNSRTSRLGSKTCGSVIDYCKQLVTILRAIRVLGLIYFVRVIGDEMRGIH